MMMKLENRKIGSDVCNTLRTISSHWKRHGNLGVSRGESAGDLCGPSEMIKQIALVGWVREEDEVIIADA